MKVKMKLKVSSSVCMTCCNSVEYSLPGSSVHGIFQEWVAISLTRGSNLGLSYCRWILYHLSHQGSLTYFTHSINNVYILIPVSQFIPTLKPVSSF